MSALPAHQPLPAANEDRLQLAPHIAEAVWRGNELGHQVAAEALSSGWEALDAELPGGGWPRRAVTEILAAQPSVVEWRLLSPGLRQVVQSGGQIVVIGPPRHPHLPGLQHMGLSERQFVWIQADAPAERLWTTEQLIKSNAAGAVIAWLPKVRADQLRRLQVCALACDGLVFLCRPEAARHEASAAPLRVQAAAGEDWDLSVHLLKRRGPPHEQALQLPSIPGGLASVLTPRMRRSAPVLREAPHAVGRPVVAVRPEHAAVG
ncbi:translesion DNA synthesis-associated protein ImuA [Pseudorhodoferax sp. Leaf267]|uniref:translesion DNA synthesis-associated protein ImuA n=1 Tax=Pseudorhodoferax sp. Leaf267 TaxID=1736316 RepID=UPI0006FFB3AC|nr:translesion DNA synthesis-associated protein ImuA [Pseudorhodoferax sp. Leaf267]KQP22125.1 recombinase RecA [Pseudorhodoferax sp. Leaf267]